jgi:hypothetical protein
MNRHKRVGPIVFSGQKLAQLELIQLVRQPVVFGYHFFLGLRAMHRIVFFRSELLQRAEIFDLEFQLLKRIDQRTQSRNFFDISLGALPIRPEIRRSHPGFNCIQIFLKLFDVKETSATRARATSDPQHLEWRFPLA